MRPDFHILLVEDSPTDALIIGRALREGRVAHRLTVIRDGRQGPGYLDPPPQPAHAGRPGAGPDPAGPEPARARRLPGPGPRSRPTPFLRAIPVVILTTSRREEDIVQTYQAGANTYIQKPAEYPRYRDLVQTLHDYWHETALRLPRGNRPRPAATRSPRARAPARWPIARTAPPHQGCPRQARSVSGERPAVPRAEGHAPIAALGQGRAS
jgi:CheY-like chemotaxis protein